MRMCVCIYVCVCMYVCIYVYVCMYVICVRYVCMCRVRMVPCDSHVTIRTVYTTYAAALKTTTHPKTQCRKPYAATQHLMLLMMGVCTRNMSS